MEGAFLNQGASVDKVRSSRVITAVLWMKIRSAVSTFQNHFLNLSSKNADRQPLRMESDGAYFLDMLNNECTLNYIAWREWHCIQILTYHSNFNAYRNRNATKHLKYRREKMPVSLPSSEQSQLPTWWRQPWVLREWTKSSKRYPRATNRFQLPMMELPSFDP